ncbi:hypothetical protein OG601_46595 [Streptomyces sp. NBC_01239]|uniref:hypothetical protein n=1 Tax=Streptomyces sp. NBC_01239 TaxID=2903792 RepID=UPI002256E252|nr:hypothetical protein [Streptomyces sp. NBC_01239]MCX4818047.1 hypothetical protein [Streptomyces sp. NBC_01239]
MNTALAALSAAATSVVVTVCSIFLSERQQRRREVRGQRQELNAKYLNPLRLHLVENHFRLSRIRNHTSAHGPDAGLLVVEEPTEVSAKDAAWFTGPGCALMSSVYLTSCLFAQLKKVREDFPYLRLSATDDTRLAALLLRVQRGFLVNGGVYYVTQPSIGESVWVRGDERLLTYREFCEKLQDPTWRVWIDRLIVFYLDTARGEKTQRTERLLTALAQLSEFLDDCVGGGKSIESRMQAESNSPL